MLYPSLLASLLLMDCLLNPLHHNMIVKMNLKLTYVLEIYTGRNNKRIA